ncbi:MAG TPA: methylenetetrahydrofolate reductase [NAD(P)H] [Clostridiaceae bacterium]|nr:methylenetetrahydrofolate reductase [NAD(P)H] [Clostridiaceae bacterium]
MKIIDIIKSKKPVLGFEIFPPKQNTPIETIYNSLEKFKALNPDYISVTYGAGGSTKRNTIDVASKIKSEYGIESMAHFTCVCHQEEEIDNLLEIMSEEGLENILALRGDPPRDKPDYDFTGCAYRYASDLVRHIHSKNKFCIAAAAYTEGHVESARILDDIKHLKIKVDHGVDFLITQLFFDNRLYFDFVERISDHGISCPVMPGIMPVFAADQIKTMCLRSGCSIPAKLVLLMDKYSGNPDDMLKAGIEYAAEQISELIENGAPGIHLYTMNRPVSTRKILRAANLLS